MGEQGDSQLPQGRGCSSPAGVISSERGHLVFQLRWTSHETLGFQRLE